MELVKSYHIQIIRIVYFRFTRFALWFETSVSRSL